MTNEVWKQVERLHKTAREYWLQTGQESVGHVENITQTALMYRGEKIGTDVADLIVVSLRVAGKDEAFPRNVLDEIERLVQVVCFEAEEKEYDETA